MASAVEKQFSKYSVCVYIYIYIYAVRYEVNVVWHGSFEKSRNEAPMLLVKAISHIPMPMCPHNWF